MERGRQKSYDLPLQVVLLILEYNVHEYPKYLLISPAWHLSVQTAVDQLANGVENQFIGLYAEQLDFHGSFTRASP
jgi:hypothetical protein